MTRREQIWASYYADRGEFDGEARLLYDARSGKIAGSETIFHAPSEPGDGSLWIIVHDNRGGANWRQIPLHVR